jgi:hypothetical protein
MMIEGRSALVDVSVCERIPLVAPSVYSFRMFVQLGETLGGGGR